MKKTRIVNRKPNRKNMTECKTCDNDIALNAEVCPHCGDSSPLKIKPFLERQLTKVIILVIVMTIAFKLITSQLTTMTKDIQDNFKKMGEKTIQTQKERNEKIMKEAK